MKALDTERTDSSQDRQPSGGFWRRYGAQIIALLGSIGITACAAILADDLRQFQGLGYLGVFIVAVISNATVILPVPGIAVVYAGGSLLNPLIVALVAGVGEPLGELSGYLAGYAGTAIVEDSARLRWVRRYMERHGFLTLLVLSAIPNPLFDLAGITAGMLRVPVRRFLLACWIGKTIKSLVVAFLGTISLGRLLR